MSRASLAAAFVASAAACEGLSADQPWALGEKRTYAPTMEHLTADTSAGPFHVLVPLGVRRRALALVATDSLVIGKGSQVVKPQGRASSPRPELVASMGELTLRPEARVGSVYGYGDKTVLENGATVRGYVRAATGVQRAGARVGLGLLEHAAAPVEMFHWEVDVPSRSDGDRASTDTERLELEPGSYGTLTVEPGSTTVLSTGEYHLDALEIRRQGIVEVDNSDGPVYVWVRRKLVLNGPIFEAFLEPTLLLGYAGATQPVISAPLRMTLVAPSATVHLPATDAPHSGAVFARAIVLGEGATFQHRSFSA